MSNHYLCQVSYSDGESTFATLTPEMIKIWRNKEYVHIKVIRCVDDLSREERAHLLVQFSRAWDKF